MANSTTLAELRTAAREDAESEHSQFVSDRQLDRWLNRAHSELYDLLVSAQPEYFKSEKTITLVSGQEEYALPSDFHSLLQLFYVEGSVRRRLESFMLDELTDFEVDNVSPSLSTGYFIRYRLIGDKLFLSPKPTGSGSLELWYVPECKTLKTARSRITYAAKPGWQEFISSYGAIRILQKGDENANDLLRDREAYRQEIQEIAKQRDRGTAQRVTDVYGFSRRRRRFGRR